MILHASHFLCGEAGGNEFWQPCLLLLHVRAAGAAGAVLSGTWPGGAGPVLDTCDAVAVRSSGGAAGSSGTCVREG
jgi:hypothetical protein